MKPCPSGHLPPSLTPCVSPASITSALSRSHSPNVRGHSRNDHRRRQPGRSQPPKLRHLFPRASCPPHSGGGKRFFFLASPPHPGGSRRRPPREAKEPGRRPAGAPFHR